MKHASLINDLQIIRDKLRRLYDNFAHDPTKRTASEQACQELILHAKWTVDDAIRELIAK